MKKRKRDLSSLLDNKRFVMVLSVAIAIVAWTIVVLSISPQKSTVIAKIPVNLAYNASAYQSLGLEVVDEGVVTVDVAVTGPRSVVGGLTAADFVAFPQISQVTAAGRYDLPVVVSKANTVKDFEITQIIPSTVSVRFDRVKTQKFTVETDLAGIRIADGYILGQGYATPGEVTLTGPENEMSMVSRVVASVKLDKQQQSTSITMAELQLYDKEGNLLPKSYITFDNEQVEVTVPVLKKADLPLKIEFINVPAGFNTDLLSYTLSSSTLSVAGPAASVDSMKEIVVGYVDLQTFAIGKEYRFDVQLPTGFTNLENVEQVTATFKQEGLSQKTVSVSDIRVVNQPENYDITVQNQRIYSVKLIGPKEVLSALPATGVIAQIDAADITVESGQQNVPVRILIPSSDKVFATGSYTVVVNIRAR